MYLSDRLINMLCKYNVTFSVNYKSGEYGSNIECITITTHQIIIKDRNRCDGYLLEVNGDQEEVKNLESLCVRLLDEKVFPPDAWF